MKIVLACRIYPTHRPGGMPFVCQDRAEALAALGHEVHVLTTSHPKYNKPSVFGGATVWHLSCKAQSYSVEFAALCERTCEAICPDIIHSDSLDASNPWWLKFKCRKAVTLHGFSWGGFLTQWNLFCIGKAKAPVFNAQGMLKEREVLKTFDAVIGVSKHEQLLLMNMFHLFNAKLVYNPIAECFFKTSVRLPEARRFLCTAISGQSERLFEMASQAAKSIGAELVTVGNKSRSQMPEVYDSCSALIVPTAYSQGYDLTVAEATARQRPVIASAIGSYLMEASMHESIRLFRFGDKSSLQKAMQEPLPEVDQQAASMHRPEIHARSWLEAVT